MISSEMPNPPSAPSQPQPPVAPAPLSAQPAARLVSARYSLIFGVALTIVTLVALVVAFLSSDFRPRASQTLPSTWSRVYSANLTAADDGAWDETQGCSVTALGLDASATSAGDAQCVFRPSVQSAVTSAGFYFETTLAPAANVPAFVHSVVSIGDISANNAANGAVIHFIIGQDGTYTLCDSVCTPGGSIYLHGGLASWHGDALIANTVAVLVAPDHSALTIFVNDQEVATVAPQFSAQPAIAVGAPAGSEAIFTQASLYASQ